MPVRFPGNVLVDTPAGRDPSGDCPVSVRVGPGDDVAELRKRYGARLYNFELGADTPLSPGLLRALKGSRVRIRWSAGTPLESDEVLQGLAGMMPVFEISPDERLLRHVNFFTSLNYVVHVDASAPIQNEEALLKTVDFYLHNPLLAVPVEPFHDLLRTASRGRGSDLWEIERENVCSNMFLVDSGEVTLSRRWYEKGLCYGSQDDSWEDIVGSELYATLSNFKVELFRRKNECVFCRHLDLCGGFFRAVDPRWPCGAWQRIFGILREEERRAKELQKQMDES